MSKESNEGQFCTEQLPKFIQEAIKRGSMPILGRFEFWVGGTRIVCDSARDAARVAYEFCMLLPDKEDGDGVETQQKKASFSNLKIRLEPTTTRFLRILHDSGSEGICPSDLAKHLGVKSARGLGGTMLGINTELKWLGFNKDEIYNTKRDRKGRRMWYGGKRLSEIVNHLVENERVEDEKPKQK